MAPSGDLLTTPNLGPVVVKVNSAGIASVVAGNGVLGFSGDGGPAVAASLNGPCVLAIDARGGILIQDIGNGRIRKVDSQGTISTLTTVPFFNKLVLGPDGSIYGSQSTNHRVVRITPTGSLVTVAGTGQAGFSGDGGPATSAALNQPIGLALDSTGNLYIADSNNHRIRRVRPDGTISTVAGNGFSQFFEYLALDKSENLYATTPLQVLSVSTAGSLKTVAGSAVSSGFQGDGGPATAALLSSPTGIAFGSDGSIYVADGDNYRIRRIAPNGIITTIAGNGFSYMFGGDGGPAVNASFNYPTGVAVSPARQIYVADQNNHRIRVIDSHGVVTTVAGIGTVGFSGDGGPSTQSFFAYPNAVAVDTSGNLFVVDAGNDRVRKIGLDGRVSTVAGNGYGGFSGDGGAATQATLGLGRFNPCGLAVDKQGNLFIADLGNRRVRRISTAGIIVTVAGTGASGASGDGGAATAAAVSPDSVAVDAAGNLYVADSQNHRIRRVDLTGNISTFAGNADSLASPVMEEIHFWQL
jgi:sugar lactone lactonase YvrE